MLILTDEGAKRVVNSSTGSATPSFDGAISMLFTNSPALGPGTVKGDLVEATYGSYINQLITWNLPVRQVDTSLASNSNLITWPGTSDSITETITGHGILASDSTTLLGAEIFSQPIPIVDVLSGFDLSVQLAVNTPGNNNGAATVIQ